MFVSYLLEDSSSSFVSPRLSKYIFEGIYTPTLEGWQTGLPDPSWASDGLRPYFAQYCSRICIG